MAYDPRHVATLRGVPILRRALLFPMLLPVLVPVLVGANVGAAELPVLGDRSSAHVSTTVERQLAEVALKQIRASLDTIADPILKYYVHASRA